jgi:hypothetical protein
MENLDILLMVKKKSTLQRLATRVQTLVCDLLVKVGHEYDLQSIECLPSGAKTDFRAPNFCPEV